MKYFSDRMMWIGRLRSAALGTTAIALALGVGFVSGKAQAEERLADLNIEEVVVTGSRIIRPDFESASPVVSFDTTVFQNTGSATLDTALNQMPQLVAQSTANTNSPGGGTPAIQLRGLAPARTLVLLDGRRFIGNLVNIPTALVERVDILSGGASAAYGSDAIAGVVNIRLKHNMQGFEVDTQVGVTERGDGLNHQISLAWGGDIGDGKGNVSVALLRQWREISYARDRSFSSVQQLSTTLPEGAVAINGGNLPSQAAVNAIFARYGVAPGTVSNATSFGVNTNGTLFRGAGPAINYLGSLTGDYTAAANGTVNWHAGNYFYLEAPLNSHSAFTQGHYDVSDRVTLYGQALFNRYLSSFALGPAPTGVFASQTLSIPVTNPFIPADLAQLLASRPNPTAPFTYTKRLESQNPRRTDITNNTFDIVTGLRGDIPAVDGHWDIYVSHSNSRAEQLLNSANITNLQTLLSAANGGTSICAGGYNPFGRQPISAACVAYVNASEPLITNNKQTVVEGTLQGTIFSLPAGDLSALIGGDYRRNTLASLTTGLLRTGALPTNAPQEPVTGTIEVSEVFTEFFVPVLRDKPFAHKVDVNLGYRYSDYSTSGGVSTYKADGTWYVVEDVGLRGGYQRAIRSPTVLDLFSAQRTGSVVLGTPGSLGQGDPCDINGAYRKGANGAQVRTLCLAQGIPASIIDQFVNPNSSTPSVLGGNPNLNPEKANTYSIGAVWRASEDLPGFKNLQMSIDYVNIDLKGGLGSVGGSTAVPRCFNSTGTSNPTYSNSSPFCTIITRDASGNIALIAETTQNLNRIKDSAVDFQINWTTELGAKAGSLNVNSLVTYWVNYSFQGTPGDAPIVTVGAIGGNNGTRPKWRATTDIRWDLDPFSVGLRWRYMDSMISGTAVGVVGSTAKGVPSTNYFDLNGRWGVTERLAVRVGILNLLDKTPPNYTGSVQHNTEAGTFDVMGRRYFVGMTLKF
jgi:iron complex outermembrane receptor protein